MIIRISAAALQLGWNLKSDPVLFKPGVRVSFACLALHEERCTDSILMKLDANRFP